MRYDHFFWDFDGTLYDTYGRITRACVKSLADIGVTAAFDAVYPVVKRSLDRCWLTFAAPAGCGREAFREIYHSHSEEEGPESIRPFPGAVEALRYAAEHGGKNYLYTHRGASAEKWLSCDGLTPLFADQVTRLDGFPAKPAPDALNYLADKHGLNRAACVMIGDRDIDLDAGKNARMACALFDPEGFFPDYDTPWRFKTMDELRKTLMEK